MSPSRISEDDTTAIPPFPNSVPTAPLLTISLSKLRTHDDHEEQRLWNACQNLGFFYLDLRDSSSTPTFTSAPAPADTNTWTGEALLEDASSLFDLQKRVFDLPPEEKQKYDFYDRGSYFGYKGYGQGVIDKKGTGDRNEFYNISKDDILDVTPESRLPSPEVLEPGSPHRKTLERFMRGSHSVVSLILGVLNERLGLPEGRLTGLHRLEQVSGDQVRFVKAPPQPVDDRRVALGEHTDFGSVTVLFNRVGGLQVRLPSAVAAMAPSQPDESVRTMTQDGWAYVRPLEGHAIVNLGDALVKFSAGLLRSNIHRVVAPPGDQAQEVRYSLVYFARPEDEVVLRALEESEAVGSEVKRLGLQDEEQISAKEWILRRALGRRRGGDWEKAGGTENVSLRKGG